MYCSNCGTQLVEGASFCSGCGERIPHQDPTGQASMGQAPIGKTSMRKSPPKIQKKGKRFRKAIFVMYAIGAIVAITVTYSELSNLSTQGEVESAAEQQLTVEELKAQGLEFDERSWNDFLRLYEAHNDFMKTVDLYANGNVSQLDFYDYCKNIEEWFGKASRNFNYAKTEDEKTYLSTFSTFALSDQAAAKNLIKYLDSNATKDLSKAREELDRAKQAAGIIARNRVVYLKSIGLSTEEAEVEINKTAAEIERIESK